MRLPLPVSALACLLLLLACAPAGGQTTWDRDAVYKQRIAELTKAIADRPDDPNPLIDLGAFYLKPLAMRTVEAADGKMATFLVPLRSEVTGPIKNTYAVPWVFRGDTSAAWPYLKKAHDMDPKNTRARRELAMYYRMRGDLDRMKPHMEAALAANPMDLDMCRLYLDHRTTLAYVLDNQAADLRTPKTREERIGDVIKKTTTFPTSFDHARADAIDEQAKQTRRDAIRPMQNLAGKLKNDPMLEKDAAKRSKWRLATAIYAQWIGELEKAAGTSIAALREDPTNLDALDYLIDILRGTKTKESHKTYKAILDRWGGTDSAPVIVEDKTVRPKR